MRYFSITSSSRTKVNRRSNNWEWLINTSCIFWDSMAFLIIWRIWILFWSTTTVILSLKMWRIRLISRRSQSGLSNLLLYCCGHCNLFRLRLSQCMRRPSTCRLLKRLIILSKWTDNRNNLESSNGISERTPKLYHFSGTVQNSWNKFSSIKSSEARRKPAINTYSWRNSSNHYWNYRAWPTRTLTPSLRIYLRNFTCLNKAYFIMSSSKLCNGWHLPWSAPRKTATILKTKRSKLY